MLVEVDATGLMDGETRSVRVAGRHLLLVRWGEEVLAIRNVCPHMSTELTGGLIKARLTSSVVGEIDRLPAEPVIECPLHNFQFDVRTGKCLVDDNLRIKAYAVRMDGEKVFVDLPGGSRSTVPA